MAVLKNLKEFCWPRNPQEALQHLARWEGRARVLAGGTWISEERGLDVEALVDISRCGLDYIRRDPEGLHIGGAATIQALADHPEVKRHGGGVLAEAARNFSPRTVRNLATIAGNLVPAFPLADLPPAVIALDGQVKILGLEGRAVLPAEKFMETHRWLTVGRTDLLEELLLPARSENWSAALLRFSRSVQDYAMAISCAALDLNPEKKVCRQARIVISACTRHPMRFPEAESVLIGKQVTPALAGEAAQIVFEHVEPMREYRGSPEYRKELARVLTKRAILQAWEKAR